MRFAKRSANAALVTLVALTAAVGVAACGSSAAASSKKVAATSSTSTTGSGAAGNAARSAFTACLKQHGVTLPAGGAGGFRRRTTTNGTPPTGTPPNGTPPNGGGYGGGGGFFGGGGGGAGGGGRGPGGFAGGNSKFAKAFTACRSKLPAGFGGGSGRPGGRPGGTGGGTQFSKATLTSFVACVRKHGYAAMPEANTSGKGAVFPASIEKNAKFKAASQKCISILRSGFRPSSGAAQPGTSASSST